LTKKKKKSITTRRGDKGRTSLLDGTRTGKDSARPEAYGTLDEAAAFIGLARAKTGLPRVKETLLSVQNLIFRANAELACPPESRRLVKRPLTARDVETLTDLVAEIEGTLDLPPRFVIYGETETAALLDVARAVARRCERALARLDAEEEIGNPAIKAFVNRLSDALFILARLEEREAGVSPRHPD